MKEYTMKNQKNFMKHLPVQNCVSFPHRGWTEHSEQSYRKSAPQIPLESLPQELGSESSSVVAGEEGGREDGGGGGGFIIAS